MRQSPFAADNVIEGDQQGSASDVQQKNNELNSETGQRAG
jgi:hypothetical protein